ncbi:MAG: redox-sensing transcriptional repressor Rex [Planctomycetaceae bacterium]|nr:redox-sensing transcriptional repressor Rex [Planctomycetaceae bacterium]
MDGKHNIPRPTARRLSLYLRELVVLLSANRMMVSSKQIGALLGLTDAQVRKDLTFVGQFGHSGVGYDVRKLHENLRRILGRDLVWNAALIGAGNIGRALLSYRPFDELNFHITSVFDSDPASWGIVLNKRTVQPISELETTLENSGVRLGIIAVPSDAAQGVADRLVEYGIDGILNFAPRRLELNPDVIVSNVDFTLSFEQLAFQVAQASHLSPDKENDDHSR